MDANSTCRVYLIEWPGFGELAFFARTDRQTTTDRHDTSLPLAHASRVIKVAMVSVPKR